MNNNNPERKRNKYFKNEAERNIWIRINAERIRYCNEKIGVDKPMGSSIDDRHTCMWVSNNQLNYDELESDALRLSLEELLLHSLEELYRITEKKLEDEMQEVFNKCEEERKRREQNGEEMA